jgi:DNA (cytosine-5)-methyltransferase 1
MNLNRKCKTKVASSTSATDIAHKFSYSERGIERSLEYQGRNFASFLEVSASERSGRPSDDWFVNYLKGAKVIPGSPDLGVIKIVDLFCGCGGLTRGVVEAANFLGFKTKINASVELDVEALDIYQSNFTPSTIIPRSVTSAVSYQLWREKEQIVFSNTPKLCDELSPYVNITDIVIGGPPCQGHSGFNNHTRGDDTRNKLYFTVPAIGIALNAPLILIENVSRIERDKSSVVIKAINILENAGYFVQTHKCRADDFGVSQMRERHFLVASKFQIPDLKAIALSLSQSPIGSSSAISDLSPCMSENVFNTPSTLDKTNQERIEFLFNNNLYNLPNHVRPECHKDGHTYPSVYGRLIPDKPANTITTGFMSPGRGRYVHPTERRCLTPHEAARLQGFSDSFRFNCSSGRVSTKKTLSKVIGDAVPPPLAFVPALSLFLTKIINE